MQGAPHGFGLGFFFVIKTKGCQSLKLRGACSLCQWFFLLKRISFGWGFWVGGFGWGFWIGFWIIVTVIASKTGALYFLQVVMGYDKSIYLQNP